MAAPTRTPEIRINVRTMQEVRKALSVISQIITNTSTILTQQAVAPDKNDDASGGWKRGDVWQTTSNHIYELVDPTTGAAEWKKQIDLATAPGDGGVAGGPTVLGRILAQDTNGIWQSLDPETDGSILMLDSTKELGVKWDSDSGTGSVYFEVYMRATSGTVYADLYDETGSAQVSGSQIATTSSTFTLRRTVALTLNIDSTYRPRFGVIGTDTGEGLGAVVLAI
jgi:hypothetical protein